MDFLPPVVVKLLADIGEFNAAMAGAEAKLTGFAGAQQRLAGAGKVAALALGVAVAGAAYESVKLASNFDQAMELIHTQAGAAQSEVDRLKDEVLKLAPATGIGPEKLAEGLYHIESTGFRGKEALDILAASARLAAMGMADLDTVTFAMSGVMSVGMKDVMNAADATNYLNTIVGMGDMKMEKLAAAIGTGILPSMKSAGLGMMDFGAALATITDNSVGADEAATRLRMTVSLMAAPSHKAAGALESIGISSTQLADDMRKPNGLLVAVMDLKHHLEASGKTASEQNAVISDAFGGGRTSSAILTLLEESDRLKSKYDQLGDAGGRAKKADEAWAAQQKQFSQQMKEFRASAEALGVKVGEWLIPKLQTMGDWLSKHIGVVKIIAVVIGSILVAAIGMWTAAVIENTIAMLANPTTWIILAIIAAIALLAIGIYELVKHWSTVWGWIKRIALDVWGWLVDAWNWVWGKIKAVVFWIKANIVDPIVHFFEEYLVKPIKQRLENVYKVWQFIWGFMSVVLDDFKKFWSRTWKDITAVILWAHDNVIKPIADAINKYAITPVRNTIKWLGDEWGKIWKAITDAMLWAHDKVVKPTSDKIQKYAINPIKDAIGWLKDAWDTAWHAVSGAMDWVWGKLKPIFDKISGAIKTVKDGISSIINSPGKAGQTLAHMMGFDVGGWVPGAPGEPMLAVVHGGEFVLSREMIAAGRGGPVTGPSPSSYSAARAGGGGGGDIVIHNKLYVDGQELHGVLIGPAQRYKARTGSTGLS